jgi:hypothetical protein
MDILLSIVVFAALVFTFFKWVLPFIKARNAASAKTAIQDYGPQSKPVTHGPNVGSKPPADNRPKPPTPERKGDV